jgi:hypothetical protein
MRLRLGEPRSDGSRFHNKTLGNDFAACTISLGDLSLGHELNPLVCELEWFVHPLVAEVLQTRSRE